ncbi:hypothetical protein SKAU_G00411170 [Synaphobranchus kaupii]|uniref:Reverse transcriptase domain-containing protein n=1 Tax=Synaphobranchus kaupii TaxID=118154 RepID=A0A9Q1E7S2_SYNKA|nr:hypothetical protein SKAU_G00411170 [Synaphobranchus kaupii]
MFERLILNRIAPFIDEQIIPEQAGFRPGKSTTSQLINLTQHIEDGFERGQITGAVFVDLSATYDTVNHRRLLCKILEITKDTHLTELMENMLQNQRFFVELGGKCSGWRKQKNGLPQDDLCITAQATDFISIEEMLTEALSGLTTYYEENHLHANPSKTQICAFHLRSKVAKCQLNISWSGIPLTHSEHPVYLGVTLDRCLTFKTHVEKTKEKVSTCNNILRKLTNTRWGACPKTLRSTALALCFSTAEYACSAWERSTHAKKLDPVLNESCRCITGCLKSTNISNLHILAGIAPPDIRRAVASMTEQRRQATDERHALHGHVPAPSRLKSQRSFMTSTTPLDPTPSEARLAMWKKKLADHQHSTTMHIPLPKISHQEITTGQSGSV